MDDERRGSLQTMQATKQPRDIEEAIGAHYALQVALQTMKERCQRLQQQLQIVEEENHRLRLMKGGDACDGSSSDILNGDSNEQSEVQKLRDKVVLLTRQKVYLSEQINMVALENKQLWHRLSSLTQVNQSLGSHLTKISDTLRKHRSEQDESVLQCSTNFGSPKKMVEKDVSLLHKSVRSSSVLKDIRDSSSPKAGVGIEEETLEEISLKLINNILLEKSELEQQYAQMVEIQNASSLSFHNAGFGYLEDDDSSSIEDMKQHCEKLQEMKETLLKQQAAMRSAITNLSQSKNFQGTECLKCMHREARVSDGELKELETLKHWGSSGHSYSSTGDNDVMEKLKDVAEPPASSYEVSEQDHANDSSFPRLDLLGSDEKVCPLCSKVYAEGVEYKIFERHVIGHFEDEEVGEQFEMIP